MSLPESLHGRRRFLIKHVPKLRQIGFTVVWAFSTVEVNCTEGVLVGGRRQVWGVGRFLRTDMGLAALGLALREVALCLIISCLGGLIGPCGSSSTPLRWLLLPDLGMVISSIF